MHKFEDIEKEIGLREAEKKFGDLLCAVLQAPRSRLTKLTLMSGEGIREGGTLMEYQFEPKLTVDEEKTVASFFSYISKLYGGRPPEKIEEV